MVELNKQLKIPTSFSPEKSEISESSSAQKSAFQMASYQGQVDAFEQTPFYNRTPQERIDFLQKRKDRGETLTAVVFDSFYQEEEKVHDSEISLKEKNRLKRKLKKQSDINGDGHPDKLMHGDIVAAFHKANGTQVIPADISGVRPEQQNDSFSSNSQRREEWISKIERGEIETDMAQLSLNPVYIYQGERKKTTYDDLERLSGVTNITPENLHEKRDDIMAAFEAKYNASRRATEADYKNKSKNSQDINDLIFIEKTVEMARHVQRLNRVGVTTVVSGGNVGLVNTSDEIINTYSLGNHVVSVGGLDELGEKADFSANHSLITHWRSGVYMAKTLENGVDITGDNKLDFPLSVLNFEGENLFKDKKFRGKKSIEVQGKITPKLEKLAKELREKEGGIIPKKEWEVLLEKLDSDKLYSNTELKVLRGRLSKEESTLPQYANPFYRSSDPLLKMIEDKTGVLDYYTRRPGTSYAAPKVP